MRKPIIVWLILSLIWGSTWLFIKIGLRDLPPVTFAGMRFVIAATFLVALIKVQRRRWPKTQHEWWMIALTGVMAFTVNYGLLFWGEQYTSSGLAAVLQAIIPAFGLLIAHYYLPGERITPAKIFGVVLGIVGVGIIFSNQMSVEGPMALAGGAAIVLGAFSVAYSNVLVKARCAKLDPAVLAAGQMICGLVPLMVIGIVWEGNPLKFRWTGQAILSLLYLAVIGSAFAFLLFYWLVRNMDVTKTMLISLVTPVIAVGLGMVTLGEILTWRIVAGTLCIIAGIGLIIFKKRT
ncbi:MAG TPA: EamA family transporter [Blastocatellia bacterium]|nr:EamA family transporter [Blastocatellia bacterium]